MPDDRVHEKQNGVLENIILYKLKTKEIIYVIGFISGIC